MAEIHVGRYGTSLEMGGLRLDSFTSNRRVQVLASTVGNTVAVTIPEDDVETVIDFLQQYVDSRPKLTPPEHPGSVVKAKYGTSDVVLVKNSAGEWDDLTGWFAGVLDNEITVREIVFSAPEGLIKE